MADSALLLSRLREQYLVPIERLLHAPLLTNSDRPELIRLRSRLELALGILRADEATSALTLEQLQELSRDLAANPMLNPPACHAVMPRGPMQSAVPSAASAAMLSAGPSVSPSPTPPAAPTALPSAVPSAVPSAAPLASRPFAPPHTWVGVPPNGPSRADPKLLLAGAALLKHLRGTSHAVQLDVRRGSTEHSRVETAGGAAGDATGGAADAVADAASDAAADTAADADDDDYANADGDDHADADTDTRAVLERLRKVMYSFGDAPEPHVACARVALEHVMRWQRVAITRGARAPSGALDVDWLRAVFPREWAEFGHVEHAKRTGDADMADEVDARAGMSRVVLPVVLPGASESAIESASGAAASIASADLDGVERPLVAERLRFADARTRTMSLDEYDRFCAARARSLACGGFVRLTASNLEAIVRAQAWPPAPSAAAEVSGRNVAATATRFLAKLCTLRVAELVEAANRARATEICADAERSGSEQSDAMRSDAMRSDAEQSNVERSDATLADVREPLPLWAYERAASVLQGLMQPPRPPRPSALPWRVQPLNSGPPHAQPTSNPSKRSRHAETAAEPTPPGQHARRAQHTSNLGAAPATGLSVRWSKPTQLRPAAALASAPTSSNV